MCTRRPCRPTASTAPGASPSASAAAMTESRRAVSPRSIPTDVGDALTSVGVAGTREELRMVVTTGVIRGVVGARGPVGVVIGRAQAPAVKVAANASVPRKRAVCIVSRNYPVAGLTFETNGQSISRDARIHLDPGGKSDSTVRVGDR